MADILERASQLEQLSPSQVEKMMQTVASLVKFGNVLRTAQMNNKAVSRSVCVCVCVCVYVCVCVCVCVKMMQTVTCLVKFGDVLRTAQMKNNAVNR